MNDYIMIINDISVYNVVIGDPWDNNGIIMGINAIIMG